MNTLSESEDISIDVNVDGLSEESNEDVGPFVRDCIDKCKEFLVEDVIKKFDKEGLLLHFMAFMQMISSGQLSVVNMAVLLAMEMALLFSLLSTTQMRYRNDTSLFWETVLSVGRPRTLRLFSSDKHFGQVNSGQSMKSKYNPSKGHFNFTVPDEKTLRKSKTGLPKVIKCGIIDEALNLVDKKKQFVLSMDGKQLIPGLINESEGDVNLWGYEGPPTLIENLARLSREEDIIIDVVGKASIEKNSIDKYCKDFKIIVQLITKRIRGLREAKVRQEQLRSRFNKKILSTPDIGSKYAVAFSDIDCFICRADSAIDNLLKINVKWCYIMSLVNGNSHCFRRRGPVLLDTLSNGLILREPETLLVDEFLLHNPRFIKQRSDLWTAFRKDCKLTGSTMYNALGLRSLKEQKQHYKTFIKGDAPDKEVTAVMQHGTDHEVISIICWPMQNKL